MPALRTLRISLLSEFYTFPAFRIEDPSMIVLSCLKDLYIHGESDSGSIFLLLDILVLPATVNIDIQDIATNWKKKQSWRLDRCHCTTIEAAVAH